MNYRIQRFTVKAFSLLLVLLLLIPTSGEGVNISKFEYKGLDSDIHSFEEYNSTYLFIDFFATWCIPCIQSTRELLELKAYRGDVIDIFSISVSEETDSIDAILQFKEKNNITWEMGIDPNQTLTLALNVLYIPSYALISPTGELLEFLNATDVPDVYDMIEAVDRHTQSTNTSLPPRDTSETNISISEVNVYTSLALFVIFYRKKAFFLHGNHE